MTVADEGFRRELRVLLEALADDLRTDPAEPVVADGLLRVTLDGNIVMVPLSHERHWRRFGNMPTAMVRDIAYALKRKRLRADGVTGAQVEADAHAYAEQVLRAVSLADSD